MQRAEAAAAAEASQLWSVNLPGVAAGPYNVPELRVMLTEYAWLQSQYHAGHVTSDIDFFRSLAAHMKRSWVSPVKQIMELACTTGKSEHCVSMPLPGPF